MSFIKKYVGVFVVLITASACIEPYDPPLNDEDLNYLVVDAFLDGSDGVATVKLSRSLPVKSSDPIPLVEGAVVRIEREGGASYALDQTTAGVYAAQLPGPTVGERYRIIIHTGDEHEYASDYTTMLQAPAIDSITWSAHRDGIQFEVNAHDVSGSTKYVKWSFTETYEYQSLLRSAYMFDEEGIVVSRPNELSILNCWKIDRSTNILIGSLSHLQASVLRKHPITVVPWGSRKLFKRYHIAIRQQALTEETYNYWLNLSKSTENLGGLFDPLPAEIRGNITCTRHPGEQALGIFSAAVPSERELFLSKGEIPSELARRFLDLAYCPPDTILIEDLPMVSTGTLLVDEVLGMSPDPIGYTTSMPHCIDCRYWGGTTTKPPFWD